MKIHEARKATYKTASDGEAPLLKHWYVGCILQYIDPHQLYNAKSNIYIYLQYILICK